MQTVHSMMRLHCSQASYFAVVLPTMKEMKTNIRDTLAPVNLLYAAPTDYKDRKVWAGALQASTE